MQVRGDDEMQQMIFNCVVTVFCLLVVVLAFYFLRGLKNLWRFIAKTRLYVNGLELRIRGLERKVYELPKDIVVRYDSTRREENECNHNG